jgi:hypothetical protein
MKPRVIAFYLPQFHPIPENDAWWGKGFTEWTNVGKAKPLFSGHYQPRVPADLGYYDLRLPETREAQAEMARQAEIEGFCYWHYWFGNGKRLLERPFNEVLESGKPDFPFCLAWANETWKQKTWDKNGKDTVLIEQEYPGVEDYVNHFNTLLPAFKDKRYIKVDGKPLFMIYRPFGSNEINTFIKTWKRLAKENDLEDIYFVGHYMNNDIKKYKYFEETGYNAINTLNLNGYIYDKSFLSRKIYAVWRRVIFQPYIISYKKASKYFFSDEVDTLENIFPTIVTGWDHTPRSGRNGLAMTNYTPHIFTNHVKNVLNKTKHKKNNIIFLKSWNEWAEGNYIEPDLKWGNAYLNSLSNIINEIGNI